MAQVVKTDMKRLDRLNVTAETARQYSSETFGMCSASRNMSRNDSISEIIVKHYRRWLLEKQSKCQARKIPDLILIGLPFCCRGQYLGVCRLLHGNNLDKIVFVEFPVVSYRRSVQQV